MGAISNDMLWHYHWCDPWVSLENGLMVKVGGTTTGLSHHTTKACQKTKKHISKCTYTHVSFHRRFLTLCSWGLWADFHCSSGHGGLRTCQANLYNGVFVPVCHYPLSKNKQRGAGGAGAGRYGPGPGLMGIVLRGLLGLSDKLAICVGSDHHHPRHISQRGNLQIEEISGNCSLKMPPLKTCFW